MPRFLVVALLLIFPALANAQGFSPEAAVRHMQLAEGFQATLVACEPMIRQPLSIDFDEKGRMWVLQYLQYPNPAGLKPIKQDQYLRTVWDRVPEPPPHGPRGADRITILWDPDPSGRFRQSRDFVTGLNLATGFCIGHGGVYVVQPPYLLFYPDKNGDDIPDGDPEVLLTGFGMEDTHSYANSLQWGPDGWLYGAHGSTVTAHIRGLEFQQGIWRFQPITKEFELFSEGGGNTYGLDFDKYGRAIAATNWGGKAMLHQVQGGYYVKGFSKHGPLHNPYTFGYFDHVPYEGFKGGHVTCGGVIYQGDTYPKEMEDQYIAGNLLSNAVYWHHMTPQGSSFTAQHGGDLLVANDTWFRPVDCYLGPDGSIYVADWYDKRAAHLDPVDNWDKTNGRIYRIEYRGTKQPGPFSLSKRTSQELVELLKHSNKWWRNEARLLLAERKDKTVYEALRALVRHEKDLLALEALWALYGSGGFDRQWGIELCQHPNEHVRAWAVRLLCDAKMVSSTERAALVQLASSDPSPTVRSQIACSAKRLPAADALPIAVELLYRHEDVADPHIPLLIWWAIEDKLMAAGPSFLEMLEQHTPRGFWKQPLVKTVLLERLGRRYLAEGTKGYTLAAGLLRLTPSGDDLLLVVRGMSQALEGRHLPHVPAELQPILAQRWAEQPGNADFLRLAVRLGSEPAYQRVLATTRGDAPEPERLRALALVAESRRTDALPVLLELFRTAKSENLRLAALNALNGFPQRRATDEVLGAYAKLQGKLRQSAQSLLLSRRESAIGLLGLVESGRVPPSEFALDQLRPLMEFKDERITAIVERHWGKIAAESAGEKQARISWLNIALSRGSGDSVKGKEVFNRTCAVCHTLFAEGGKIGPDLTTADRKSRGYLLTNIVDPSGYIRPEFVTHHLTTLDGRQLSGVISESTTETVTLVNVVNNQPQRTVVAKKDIEDMKASPTSLMPEKLLDSLADQEVRDLFAYLQLDRPLPNAPTAPTPSKKLRVLLISGSLEYRSDESLSELQKHLEKNYAVECLRAFRKTDDDVPGLEQLQTCDVALFFTRRLTIQGEQLNWVKQYALAGKPIVAVRTASHGFQHWLAMDKEVLGGNYGNHYGAGSKCEVRWTEAGSKHPLLQGFAPFRSSGSLYRNRNLPSDDSVLLTGTIADGTEPVAWVREQHGGRVFYTSLGHPDDFKEPSFVRLLTRALFWTARRELPDK